MTSPFKNEEILKGGQVSTVYRSGDTVRRDVKAGSIHIHRLLKHLENKGFFCAPKFLGVDDQGREILSFIEGEAGSYPLKEYMWSNQVLRDIANMLRQYHDAVSDFPLTDEWEPMDHTPNNIEVICHNDFAIYNIIFQNNKPAGIIDFDVAAPGPRIWDIAYTLYTCVPLSRIYYKETGESVYYNPTTDADRIKYRISLFFDSYGIVNEQKNFLEMVLMRLEALCTYIIRKAGEGDTAFQKMIDQGQLEHYHKDIAFIREYGKEWV